MDEIAEFEAECMVNGWNVTHPVGCILPDLIIPGVTQGDIYKVSHNRFSFPLVSKQKIDFDKKYLRFFDYLLIGWQCHGCLLSDFCSYSNV